MKQREPNWSINRRTSAATRCGDFMCHLPPLLIGWMQNAHRFGQPRLSSSTPIFSFPSPSSAGYTARS